jgi:hypothetical protein
VQLAYVNISKPDVHLNNIWKFESSHRNMVIYRKWLRLYSGGARLESRQGHLLFWSSWFSSTSIRRGKFPSKSFPIKLHPRQSVSQSVRPSAHPSIHQSYLSINPWLYSPCGPWPPFQFLDLYTVGRAPWLGDQPVARPVPTHRTAQTQNKRKQTSTPWARFESTIPVLELLKMVHVLDRAATVIGIHPRISP